MTNIDKIIKDIKPWIIEARRKLHSTPEMGLEEYVTKKTIIDYLNEIGIEFKEYETHTGVMAFIYKENAKKTIAIRADIDALPIQESNELPYKSTINGQMHACGHDAHTAILLGVCNVLVKIKEQLDVNVKLLFQPAEETVGGAELMINDGCMENPKVDYTIGLHVDPHLNTGCVELKYGTLNASTDTIEITIKGSKGHGAYPHEGIDSIVAAANVITSLQTLVSRNISPTDGVVLSLGKISGGIKENIICDEVKIGGTLRTLNSNSRAFAKQRIVDIVENTCNALMAKGEVNIERGYAPLVNDDFVVDIIKNSTEELLGKDNVLIKKQPLLGAEDFSFFLEHSKGAFYHLGCRNEAKNIIAPLHTSNFNIDEDCLEIGVAVHIANILKLGKL
ncbi:MAG: M20 metallopeptidase family protein [Peptostreptococcaceae bacterium]